VDTTGGGRSGIQDERAEFLFILYRMFAEYLSIRLRLTNNELIKTKKKLGE
jgi:CRP/FNR family cyclic AMP-dependent transcriptional regulator